MPFITIKTNAKIDRTRQLCLKELIGRAMRECLGIGEEYLLIDMQGGRNIYLRGRDDVKAAYVEISVFGNETCDGYEEFCRRFSDAFGEALGISPRNLYLNFKDVRAFAVGENFIKRRV